MFPSSGYFRSVHCPFFLNGLCERPYCHFRHTIKVDERATTKAENVPSYSTSGSKFNQQTSLYNQASYVQSNTYGQSDVAQYSTMAPTEPTGPVETYMTTSQSGPDVCSIPSFANSQSLPESLEDPVNLSALPKISGLPKNKQSSNSLPSYVPTPKVKIQPDSNVSVATYTPTPKGVTERKPSRTIEYDPVKNFAFVEKVALSSDESEVEKKRSISEKAEDPKTISFQSEVDIYEDDVSDDIKQTKWHDDDDLTDSDEDVSCRNGNTESTIEDKLMDFAALLTPSSEITEKLSLLSGDTKDLNGKIKPSEPLRKRSSEDKIKLSSISEKNPVSPDSTSKTSYSSKSENKATVHRSHSSTANSSTLESSCKTLSLKKRSLSEAESTRSHFSTKSKDKSVSRLDKSDKQNSKSSESVSKNVHKSGSHSSKSSSSSRLFVDSSSTKTLSKVKCSSSVSSSSKKTPSSKESTQRSGSSVSEKENRQTSKTKQSESSSDRISPSKLPSSTSSTNLTTYKTQSNGLNQQHKRGKSDTQIKQEKNMTTVDKDLSESISHSAKTSNSKNSSDPGCKLTTASVKNKPGNETEQRNQSHKNGTNHASNKEGSVDSKSKHHKKAYSDIVSASKVVKYEKHDSVSSEKNGASSKKNNSFPKDAPLKKEKDSDSSDSDVQIIEVPADLPEIYELSDSEDGEQEEEKSYPSDEVDILSDSDTFDECLRIFEDSEKKFADATKFYPDQSKTQQVQKIFEEPENILASVGKKRTAHKTTPNTSRPKKSSALMRPKMSPAEVMHNRIAEMQKRALLRAATREGREAELPPSLSDRNQQMSGNKTPPTSVTTHSLLASADFLIANSKKREAHCLKPPSSFSKVASSPNKCVHRPSSFYGSQKPSAPLDAGDVSGIKVVTIAGTASKTEKRKAHESTLTNTKRPIIPAVFGDKVPSNIRQRYLNLIIDEYLKFTSEEIAFQKGQEEEQAVYTRATNKNIYLSLVANAIKKIRMEASESQPSSSKKPCLGLSSLTSHPRIAQSHAATLGGSQAAKTSFTLNRSGTLGRSIITNFSGKEFYERLKKYILTEEQLRANGFPRPSLDGGSKVVFYKEDTKDSLLKDNERTCRRCGKRYFVAKDGSPLTLEKCIYHHANAYKARSSIDSRYGCCNERAGTKGCQVAECHVNERNKTDNLTGYMKTMPSEDKDFKVYSLDCEMVYTKAGLELARVTVVGEDCNTVYESLVKPETDIIDYNTRFSGITEADMKSVRTNLLGVQAVMLSMFSDKTILMGHSLESDLVALKLIHSTVVDTSLVFPHRLGPPYKRALRNLMVELLQKIIQDNAGGHDSKEDAAACMQLMHYKVKEDAKREIRRT